MIGLMAATRRKPAAHIAPTVESVAAPEMKGDPDVPL